jgi:UDP-N-acetylmuramoylalanine--D-glutamate ligase
MNTDILNIESKSVATANLAARSLSQIVDLRKKALAAMFDNYYTTTHKLEEVAIVRGIHFIDDASSININKTWFAMENVGLPIIWIMGLEAVSDNISAIVNTISQKVRIIINCGQISNTKTFENVVQTIINVPDLEMAVKTAYMYAAEGDAVLFSPSTGRMEDVAANARVFVNAVNEL